MTPSGKRSTGPRAILKNQKCREIAQLKMQRERQSVREKQNDSPYEKIESTAQSSQVLAVKRLVRPSCLDALSENDLHKLATNDENGEAVTYWSHELIAGNGNKKLHFPVTPLKRGSLFARCTSFSNEIEDSRLRHNEADELAPENEWP
mmetsp:Transcript_38891/g.81348  ORF Transcript_38891/g.81348 Transcript_38891/m.81348 type:complete len:149 (+) Transcript_38891:72-518(+)